MALAAASLMLAVPAVWAQAQGKGKPAPEAQTEVRRKPAKKGTEEGPE